MVGTDVNARVANETSDMIPNLLLYHLNAVSFEGKSRNRVADWRHDNLIVCEISEPNPSASLTFLTSIQGSNSRYLILVAQQFIIKGSDEFGFVVTRNFRRNLITLNNDMMSGEGRLRNSRPQVFATRNVSHRPIEAIARVERDSQVRKKQHHYPLVEEYRQLQRPEAGRLQQESFKVGSRLASFFGNS